MDNGRVFLGGYVNNLPVDLLRIYHAPAYIIASDVESKDDEDLQNVEDYGMQKNFAFSDPNLLSILVLTMNVCASFLFKGDSLSGWWLLGRKVLSRLPYVERVRIPTFGAIISSLIFINHNRNVRQLIHSRFLH